MTRGGRLFISLTVFFGLICLAFLIRLDKETIHLYIDSLGTPSWDGLFLFFTYLGDGLTFVAVTLLLLLGGVKLRTVAAVGLTGVSVLLLIGILKNWVFPGVLRPSLHFEEGVLRTIEGLEMHGRQSFPSGHTTSGFALSAILAFWINRRWASVLLFLIAVGIGFSRMYLNQHFLVDVFAGSLLGTLIAWGIYYWISGIKKGSARMDTPLISWKK